MRHLKRRSRITCDVTLDTDCENAGIVYGYVDNQNYWVTVWSKTGQSKNTYQISGGTWTQRGLGVSASITAGTPFSMDVEMRAGSAGGYVATVPAGQSGLWCSDASDNTFDNFKVRDIAGPFDADAAWFSTLGDVQIDESDDNVLTSNPDFVDQCIVRRGSRAGWYELIFKFKWTTVSPGALVRWLSPGDYLAIAVKDSDGKARLYQRSADGKRETKVTSGTTLSLTTGTWYTAKVLVDDDGSGGDQLRFWVDTDGDGTWTDETTLITDTTHIDGTWSAGYVGLFTGTASTQAPQEFDDVSMKIDNDADGTLDEQFFSDDFNSNSVTLTYDDNGNMTFDGMHTFVYGAWNRLRKTQMAAADTTDVAAYEYYGDNRRSEKIVQNQGGEAVDSDGGDLRGRERFLQVPMPLMRSRLLPGRSGSSQRRPGSRRGLCGC